MLISTYNIIAIVYILYNSSILIQYTSLKKSQMVIIDSFSIGYYICILIMVRFVLGRSILIRSFMRRSKNRANLKLVRSRMIPCNSRASLYMRHGIVIADLQDLCQSRTETFNSIRFNMICCNRCASDNLRHKIRIPK